MGFLDRLLNPSWKRVAELPTEKQYELALLITCSSAWLFSTRREVVGALEKELPGVPGTTPSKLPVDETTAHASLAILRGCSVPSGRPARSRIFDFEGLRTSMLGLIGVEAEAKYKDIKLYAEDPEAARTQFLVWVANRLGVDAPDFAQRLSRSGFGRQWQGAVLQGLSGLCAGAGKADEQVVIERAKKDIADLCPAAKKLVKDLALRIKVLPMYTIMGSRNREPDDVVRESVKEWRTGTRVAELVEECKSRARIFAKSLSDNNVLAALPNPALMYAFIEERVLLMAFGLIAVRRSTGPRYFIEKEWKDLAARITVEAAQMGLLSLRATVGHSGGEDQESVQRVNKSAADDVVRIRHAIYKHVDSYGITATREQRAHDIVKAVVEQMGLGGMEAVNHIYGDALREFVRATLYSSDPS